MKIPVISSRWRRRKKESSADGSFTTVLDEEKKVFPQAGQRGGPTTKRTDTSGTRGKGQENVYFKGRRSLARRYLAE